MQTALGAFVEDGDAPAVARTLDALVDGGPLEDDAWLEVIACVDQCVGAERFRRVDLQIGRALRRWLSAYVGRERFGSAELFSLALDVWRRTSDFKAQYLCDFAGAWLLADPASDDALGAFLDATFMADSQDPYLHRGIDLEAVADRLPETPRRAELLALHAIILERAGSDHAGTALARALAVHPGLDLDALRERYRRFIDPV